MWKGRASVSLVRVAGLEAPEIFTASGISPEWHVSDPHLFFSFFFFFCDLPIIRHKLKGINTDLWDLQDKSLALRLSTRQVIFGRGTRGMESAALTADKGTPPDPRPPDSRGVGLGPRGGPWGRNSRPGGC